MSFKVTEIRIIIFGSIFLESSSFEYWNYHFVCHTFHMLVILIEILNLKNQKAKECMISWFFSSFCMYVVFFSNVQIVPRDFRLITFIDVISAPKWYWGVKKCNGEVGIEMCFIVIRVRKGFSLPTDTIGKSYLKQSHHTPSPIKRSFLIFLK